MTILSNLFAKIVSILIEIYHFSFSRALSNGQKAAVGKASVGFEDVW